MKKVLVIGDVIIDRYRYGKALGISAETPTVVSEFSYEKETYGGAALVARHLHYLDDDSNGLKWRGCNTQLYSIGDYIGHRQNMGLLEDGLLHNILNIDGWITTVKERIFVDGYKLAQLDFLNKGSHNSESRAQMKRKLSALIQHHDIVAVADNRHGTIDKEMAKWIVRYCKRYGKLLCVDSQISQSKSNHHWYKGADIFFLNRKEMMEISDNHLVGIEKSVMTKLRGNLVVKLGHAGAYIITEKGKLHFSPPPDDQLNIVDTCGAGDAFMAKFIRMFDGKNWTESLTEAVKYASFTCTYYGTKTPNEIIE